MSRPLSRPVSAVIRLVLFQPDIPQNAGAMMRLAACMGVSLDLVEPCGFPLDDQRMKRAGMDYWQHVEWKRWPDWSSFYQSLPASARLWLVESNGPRLYTEARFAAEDYLVFGRETAGLPKKLLNENPDYWLRIPMFNPKSRSLNLSNCVALVLFEALRQQGFAGEG